MHTINNPPPSVIQLLLPPSHPPKFRPLTFSLPPLVLIFSKVVVSKPQLGQLGFTETNGKAERRRIHFPTRSIYPMLYEAPRRLSMSFRIRGNRLTLKATRKSSRNILSKLTCASWAGGAATIPFGPITAPGRDNDGELDEVPFRSSKNSLTAPSTSPVVYKSRPVLRS